MTPEFCLVVDDDVGLVGYALAALDAKQFHKKLELGWLPDMCRKYPQPEKNSGETLSNKEVNFFNYFYTLGIFVACIHAPCRCIAIPCLLMNILDTDITFSMAKDFFQLYHHTYLKTCEIQIWQSLKEQCFVSVMFS